MSHSPPASCPLSVRLAASRATSACARVTLALLVGLIAFGFVAEASAQKKIKDYVDEFQPRLGKIGRQVQAVQRQRVSAEELSPKRLVASLGC